MAPEAGLERRRRVIFVATPAQKEWSPVGGGIGGNRSSAVLKTNRGSYATLNLLGIDEVLPALGGKYELNANLRADVCHARKMPLRTEPGESFFGRFCNVAAPLALSGSIRDVCPRASMTRNLANARAVRQKFPDEARVRVPDRTG